MNTVSRTITGVAGCAIGVLFIVLSFFDTNTLALLVYGIPVLIIGLVILFNTKEDYVEPIKKKPSKR